MIEEKEYEELKLENFSEDILKYREAIKQDPENPMNYYFLAKEYILKVPIRAMDNLEYVENLLKKSLELRPELWAPKIFLGELLFKQGRFEEAEKYFVDVVIEKPESFSAKEYLAKCFERNTKKEEYSEKDLLYLFENDLRKFIRKVLEEEFKEDWWRKGIPAKVRADCMGRRELGLNEEKDLEPILFASFFDYKGIFQQNKGLFSNYLDVKKWSSKLNELEPLRNALAHNRDLEGAFEKVKDCYDGFREILNRINKISS